MDFSVFERPGAPWWTLWTSGLCVSVVRGVGIGEVTGSISPDAVELDSVDEAVAWTFDTDLYNRHWTAVGLVEDAVFAWEDNGWNGADPSIAGPLSAGGSVTSVYWNVNARYTFLHAVAGTVVREFDPLYRAEPDQQAWALPEEAGLVWWQADLPYVPPQEPALELMARVCGLRPQPRWLELPDVRFFGTTFS